MTPPQYRQVPAQVDLPALEHAVLDFWREQQDLRQEPGAVRGPPRVGLLRGPAHRQRHARRPPHRGPRLQGRLPPLPHHAGYHVARKAGWDCHGLPVELAVEKELGFNGKQDIEAYGIAEFNAKCRESVTRHTDAFTELTTRMGYWVDLDDAYRTMDPEYVESVWWSLKEIFNKGLLVQDHRVAPWCPRCGTGLSDHELAQGYETVVDPSVYVRFPLTSGPLAGEAALLVWTTTPWTLVSNTAVAAHPDVTYVVATDGEEKLVVAEPLLEKALGEGWEATGQTFTGARDGALDLPAPVRARRVPASRALRRQRRVRHDRGRHRSGPPVPRLRRRRPRGLPRVRPAGREPGPPRRHLRGGRPAGRRRLLQEGRRDARPPTSSARGLLFRHIPYEHSYPHCWRCHTALLYYAQPSWYIRTTAVKDALLRENEKTNWFPDIGQARPLRRLAEQQHRLGAVPQPLLGHPAADLALRGRPPHLRRLARRAHRADRHRPVGPGPAPPVHRRGHLRLPAGLPARRPPACPEVIDAWYDSGSMPFAQWGYPYKNKELFEQPLPGAVHLRGHRPDPRLVLHADGGRHPRLRQVLVRERGLPGPHPRRGRPQDVQAPGQHPAADPADGPARRRRGALVHGGRRLARGRRAASGHGTIQEVVRKTLLTYWNTVAFQALYARTAGWAPSRGRPGPGRPPAPGPLAAVRAAHPGRRGHRGAGGVRHPARRQAAVGVRRRPVQLVRPPLAPPLLAGRQGRAAHPARGRGDGHPADGPADPVHHRAGLAGPGRPGRPGRPGVGAPGHLADGGPRRRSTRRCPTQMALVRRLVELGRATRAESGVKTRQPLSRALVARRGLRRARPPSCTRRSRRS